MYLLIKCRPDLLEAVINTKDFCKQSLPDALRQVFKEFPVSVSETKAFDFINLLATKFSSRFALCNPELGLTSGMFFYLINIVIL